MRNMKCGNLSVTLQYTPPHKINKHAIIWALATHFKCERIIAFCSVGSLQKSIPVGTLMVPDDYYDPASGAITFFDYTKQGHIGPGFSEPLRAQLLACLGGLGLAGSTILSQGVYCLTSGPRFGMWGGEREKHCGIVDFDAIALFKRACHE